MTRAQPGSGHPGPKTNLTGYLAWYATAVTGIFLVWGAVGSILLPIQVQELVFHQWFRGIDAGVDLSALTNLRAQLRAGGATPVGDQVRLLSLLDGFETERAQDLSLVTSIGVLCTMLAQPVVGLLSDRTAGPWGRRSPWIAGGSVIGAGFLIALRYSPSIGWLIACWSISQTAINVAQGPLTATIADRVPHNRVASASALTGVASLVGSLAGSFLVGTLFAVAGLDAYFLLAVALGVPCLLFALTQKESRQQSGVRPGRRTIVIELLAPFTRPDYRWLWAAKLAVSVGSGMTATYSLYLMQSYIQPAMTALEAARTIPWITLAAAPLALGAMLGAGRLADRSGRRKPIAITSALVLGTAFLVPFAWPTLPALFVQGVLTSAALGTFLALDQAMFIGIIEDQHDAGRDLGLSALAGNLGQAVAPILGGAIIAATHSYAPLWAAGAVLAVAAGAFITRVAQLR
ncbi:hypothetical protein PROP_02562 [Propionicimonas sp. T2.31MG-18]|uniref:MFS transporter n=1 Tax=Propionicimonas sp. T2.31MG-18 TaxID=3157620 RepID=UPI0035EE01F6